ncbi:hypothetical protein JCM3766R1_000045 [Sporobolomyces carnicolor]
MQVHFPSLPPFPVFVEIPSIYDLVNELQDFSIARLHYEVARAQHWTKLSFARIMSKSLDRIGRPLAKGLEASLNPPGACLPFPVYDGIGSTDSLTGLAPQDPAVIEDSHLDAILDRFSTQAWFFEGQRPQSFVSVQASNQRRINSADYRGPVWPRFHEFWCLVLLQLLDKTGVADGPLEKTKGALNGLGRCFACGVCSARGEESVLFNSSEFLAHVQKHRFAPEDAPNRSLVNFLAPAKVDGNKNGVGAARA